MLGRWLVGAAVAWPLVAGAALWQRTLLSAVPGESGPGGGVVSAWAVIVYAAAGRVCHQRPERSFHTHDVAWPVCARCAGLYLAAPFAAVVAFRRRSLTVSRLPPWRLVILAAVPTVLTLLWEWGGLGTPSNLLRFSTALPLGAAIAFVLIATVTERQPSESIG
jgi:uncharacterized membrane protein